MVSITLYIDQHQSEAISINTLVIETHQFINIFTLLHTILSVITPQEFHKFTNPLTLTDGLQQRPTTRRGIIKQSVTMSR